MRAAHARRRGSASDQAEWRPDRRYGRSAPGEMGREKVVQGKHEGDRKSEGIKSDIVRLDSKQDGSSRSFTLRCLLRRY